MTSGATLGWASPSSTNPSGAPPICSVAVMMVLASDCTGTLNCSTASPTSRRTALVLAAGAAELLACPSGDEPGLLLLALLQG